MADRNMAPLAPWRQLGLVAVLILRVSVSGDTLRVVVRLDADETADAIRIAVEDMTTRLIRWKSESVDGRATDAVAVFALPPGRYRVEGQVSHCCNARGEPYATVVDGGTWEVR